MQTDKLREALAEQSVYDADTTAWIMSHDPENLCEECTSWDELLDMAHNLADGFNTLRNAINAVLSNPLRNCEYFASLTEALTAWGREAQSWLDWPSENHRNANDMINELTADQEHEFIDWLFTTDPKQEGINQ